MANENNNVKKGIGKIDTLNGNIYFDSQVTHNELDINDLANQISDKINQPIIELQTKDKEIELLQKIISELQGNDRDKEIKQYLEEGDYIAAVSLLEKSLKKSKDKLFEDEIKMIEITSLYSIKEAIILIEKNIKIYQEEYICIGKLTLTYADILLRIGKFEEALDKYIALKKLSKFKIHFLKTNQKNFIKIGLTKQDGTQLDNINNFSFEDKELDIFMTAQNYFFSNIGEADCLVNSGLYTQARNKYTIALKYALFLKDDDFIEIAYSNIAHMYYSEGNYIEAISLFNLIDDSSTKAPFKYQILIHIYSTQKNIQKLEESVKKLKNIYSDIKKSNNKYLIYYQTTYYEALGKYFLENKNYSKSEFYYLKAIKITKDINQVRTMLDIYKQIAYLYRLKGDINKEKYYFEETIKISRDYKFYSILSNTIHNYALSENNLNQRLENFKEALAINRKIDKKLSISANLSMIADTYRNLKNFKRAKKYIQNSYRIYQKLNQTKMMHYDAYYDILSLDKKDLKDYLSLLKLSRRCNNCYKKYDAYISLGEYYIKQDNLKMALKSFKKGEKELNKCSSCSDNDRFDTYAYLSEIYLNMHNLKMFKQYKEIALKYAIKKEQKLSIELFQMAFNIMTENIQEALKIADKLSLEFKVMNKNNIRTFFRILIPILNEELHHYGKKYANMYMELIKNNHTDSMNEEDTFILFNIGILYFNSFKSTQNIEIWFKSKHYLSIASDYFLKNLNKDKEYYFFLIITYLNLTALYSSITETLLVMIGDADKLATIYTLLYNSDFISDDTWEEEPFNSNKTSNYSGMVNYSIFLRKQKKYKESIKISEKNIRLLKDTSDLVHLELAISNLGITYEKCGEYHKAIMYHKEAFKYAVKLKNTYAIAHAYEHIGISYKNLDDNKEANIYFDKALYSYKKIKNKDDIERVEILKLEIGNNDA